MQPTNSQSDIAYQIHINEAIQSAIKDSGAIMTPKGFADAMQTIMTFEGIEDGHIHADNLMCYLLRQLGYGDGVDIFEDADKWYS